MIPNSSKNQFQIINLITRKSIEEYYPKYVKTPDLGFHFRESFLTISRGRAFVCDLCLGTSRGDPLGPIWASPGAALVRANPPTHWDERVEPTLLIF